MSAMSSMRYISAVLLLLIPSVENVPIGKNQAGPEEKTPTVKSKSPGEEASKALLVGKLREVFLFEEILENEILKANLELFMEGGKAKRDTNVREAAEESKALIRQKRAGELLSAFLGSKTGSSGSSITDSSDSGGFPALSLISTLFSSSSANTNSLVRTKRQQPSENEVVPSDEASTDNEEDLNPGQDNNTMNPNASDSAQRNTNRSGDGLGGGRSGRQELVNTISGLIGPLSDLSMGGGGEGSGDDESGGGSSFDANVLLNLVGPIISSSSGENSENASGGGSDSSSILGLIGPLSGASSGGDGEGSGGGSDVVGLLTSVSGTSSGGGDGEGGGGSDAIGTLTSLVGPLSASSSGGGEGEGGSDAVGLITNLAGPLSASSSGGQSQRQNGSSGGSSDVGSLVAGIIGPLSASSSGGNPDGPGGFNIGGAVAGLAGPLSASLSAGGGDSDGGGLGGSGSLISGLLGSSSGGGGGGGNGGAGTSDSSSSADEDDDDNKVDTAGGSSDLFGLVSALLAGIGNADDSGGGSGNGLIGLIANVIASSSSGGSDTNGGGNNGGGSGNFIASLLGASSGGGTQGNGSSLSNGGNDSKTEIFSLLFRLKFAIFRALLSAFFSSSGGGGKY